MRNNTIVMIAPLSTPAIRTRLSKMLPLINDREFAVRFFGWRRDVAEKNDFRPTEGLTVASILRGGGYASRKARLMYPLWMIVVFWCVLRLGRDQTIFCLGWESAFPARMAAMFTGAKIIFDDADRFSLLLKLPGPLHTLLQRLERWTSYRCALHIVPGFTRYEWQHENMLLLRNTPLKRDFEAARAVAPPRPDAALVLYANGWIGETRGAWVFLELLDRALLEKCDIKMVIAGRLDGPSAARLIDHPLVTYLGEVEQSIALSWYSAVDLLLTFYDPSVPINKKAESNKWGDAVYFDTPFLVNSEVETATRFVEASAAFSVPYADTDRCFDLLKELLRCPEKMTSTKRKLASFKDRLPVFDEGFAAIINRI